MSGAPRSLYRFDAIVGQGATVRVLRRAIERERLPHALLLHGPRGAGKRTTALALASAVSCVSRSSTADDACGSCATCRRLAALSHPDFQYVTRLPQGATYEKRKQAFLDQIPALARGQRNEPPKPLAAGIGIDQIRDVAVYAGYGPQDAARRFVFVEPADRMGTESQNALLKTLEEPGARSVVVLSTSRPYALLPTVRSRCMTLGFGAVSADRLSRALVERGFSAREAERRASLASGLVGRALTLDPDEVEERRESLLEDLEHLARGPAGLADRAARIAGRDEGELSEALDLLQTILRDASRAAVDRTDRALVHLDVAERTAAIGRTLGPRRCAELVEAVDRSKSRLAVHVNRTLVAEALLAAVAGGPLPDAVDLF